MLIQADLAANVHSIRCIPQTEKKAYDTEKFEHESEQYLQTFGNWEEHQQVQHITRLFSKMCHYQHGLVNGYLKPMLQRDFITSLPGRRVSEGGRVLCLGVTIYVHLWV